MGLDRATVRTAVGIWLVWAVVLIAFQVIVDARFDPERPDTVLEWTAAETGNRRHALKPILQDQFLPAQTEWDSEFYLSIATVGYEDPRVVVHEARESGRPITLNHAFMPLYPVAMRVVAVPFTALGLAPLAAAALAGVIISLVSTLAAMLALARLATDGLGEGAATRAALYLVLFPTGFFLATVYAEALFLALVFGSLALVGARQPLLAGIAAALAVFTRPVGVALVIPLVVGLIVAWQASRRVPVGETAADGEAAPGALARPWGWLVPWLIGIAAPLVAYAGWSIALGADFDVVQREYFGRSLLDLESTFQAWGDIVGNVSTPDPRTVVYYGLEGASTALAITASIWALRRWPGLALFGLVAILVTLTSGAPQSLIRHALAIPAIYLMLAHLGRRPWFDRGWSLLSTLLMGLLATLFTFDFWVA